MVDVILKAKASNSLPDLGDGVETQAFVDKYGGLLVQHLLPLNLAAAWRGLIFAASTPATGVAPGTVIGTTGAYTLYNPAGSGKLLIPLRVSMGYISGTIGAGTVWLLANVNLLTLAVTGTNNVVIRTHLGQSADVSAQGNTGRSFTTSTLPAAPSILRPIFNLGAHLATTPVQPYVVETDLAGAYAVKPGSAITLHSTAAGGAAPLVAFGMEWVEIDE